MNPQSRSFINNYEQLMRDIDRRLLVQERRGQRPLTGDSASHTLITVPTPTDVTDPAVWYYVVSTGLVYHAGGTMTYADWLASVT